MNTSLSQKFISTLVPIVTIGIFLCSGITIFFMREHLVKLHKADMYSDAVSIMKVLDRELFSLQSDLIATQNNPLVQEALKTKNVSAVIGLFKSLKKHKNIYSALELFDIEGQLIASSSPAMLKYEKQKGADYFGGEAWFESAINGQSNFSELEYSQRYNSYVLYFYSKVTDDNSGKALGVLREVYAWKYVVEFMHDFEKDAIQNENNSRRYYLVDDSGKILYSKNKNLILKSIDQERFPSTKAAYLHNGVMELADAKSDTDLIVASSKEVQKLFNYTLSWRVLVIESKEAILYKLLELSWIIGVVGLLTLFAIVLSVVWMSNTLTNPIRLLSDRMRLFVVGKEHSNPLVGLGGTKEMVALVDSFNAMIADLEDKTISKNYLDNILSSLVDMVFVADKEGKVKSCNESALASLGNVNEKSILSFLSFDSDFERKNIENYLSSACGKKTTIHNLQCSLVCAGGYKLPVLLSGASFVDKSHHTKLFVFSLKDVSEQKEIEARLEDAKMQNVHQSRLASMGEMAAGVAHEINNPMSVVVGNSRRILKSIQNNEVDTENISTRLDKIIKASDRVVNIVRGLKRFSREGSGDPMEIVTVSQLVNDALDLCGEKIKSRGIDIIVASNCLEIQVECRPVNISQVILNLVINANDAIQKLDERWIKLNCFERDENVIIECIDSGLGIPEEVREKILQPFFTTKPVGKGTGLGLSISKGIIEDHNGTLEIDSSTPHTCFRIILPKRQKKETDLQQVA